MNVLETASMIDLPDQRVAVCGDWHGNLSWLRTLAPAIRRLAPDVTTILQLGDWWMNTKSADQILGDSGIERVYVTLGNHEPWGDLTPLLDAHPGNAIRVSELHWILPRPHRFRIAGRQFLSLGGAASVDRHRRIEGHTWRPDEEITDGHVTAALEGGTADVMLTHESPARTPVRAVREALRINSLGVSADALVASAASRTRVSQVWDAAKPTVLFHGHMHTPGGGMNEDGRRVSSLGRDTQQGNLAILDLATLTAVAPSLREIHGA